MAHDLVFANARVKARENNLLTHDKLLRIIEGDLSEAFSALSEVQYDVESGDIDVICAKEEEKLVEFIKELDTGKPFINCLIREYDYRSLKRAFKMKIERQDFEFSPLSISGFIPLDKVKSSVMSDDYDLYPDALGELLKSLDLRSVTEKLSPSAVETSIDDSMYKSFLSELEGKTGYSYYEKRVFLTNIITLMRVNKLGLGEDFFQTQYVGERDAEYERMSRLVGESADTITEAYRVGDRKDMVEAVMSGDVDSAEAYADSLLIKELTAHRADMFSELLLAGYFVGKKAEISNVRLILTCIRNKVNSEDVIKRLRVSYYE